MASKPLNIERMLGAAFLKAELDFLRENPRFAEARSLVKNAEQFEILCILGCELLAAHHRVNPVAQQLRAGISRSFH